MGAENEVASVEHAQFDTWISTVLRGGVIASTLFVMAGGLVYLKDRTGLIPQYGSFQGEPTSMRGVVGIVSEAAVLHGPGLIQFGLLVLVATPIARVVCAVIEFVREKDRLYVAISLIVLGLLIASVTSIR